MVERVWCKCSFLKNGAFPSVHGVVHRFVFRNSDFGAVDGVD